MTAGSQKYYRTLAFWTIGGLIAIITLLHYATTTHLHYLHELYRRLYYLPIIAAAYRFGFSGGMVSAISVALLLLPHVIFQWKGAFLDNLVWYNEMILYLIIGAVAGVLSRRVQNEKNRYKKIADELETSYNRLKAQTLQISEMESQLRAADRLAVLGELTASLAHEVRNPMGSIKGAAEILKKRCQDDEIAREFSDLLAREVNRLNQVMENYLDMARRPAPADERSDLAEIITSLTTLMDSQISRKNIRLQLDLPKGRLITPMKEVEVRQVFLNLILNAIEALSEGGTVLIKAGIADDKIVVTITDTGRGIPHAELSRIFQPFYTTRKGGTGLGLAIVKRIMESSRGVISVSSSEHEGTTITLTFVKA